MALTKIKLKINNIHVYIVEYMIHLIAQLM